MSASNLAAALAFIDEDEGPELNISSTEPGGASCRGVSLLVLAEYAKAHSLPLRDIYMAAQIAFILEQEEDDEDDEHGEDCEHEHDHDHDCAHDHDHDHGHQHDHDHPHDHDH